MGHVKNDFSSGRMDATSSAIFTASPSATLRFKLGKYFPVYVGMSIQNDPVYFSKFLGTPKGPKSGRS